MASYDGSVRSGYDGYDLDENEYEEEYEEEYEYEEEEEVIFEHALPHEDDEYTESDSYKYPYATSSDDSWAELSSDEAIQKIIEKLPTYTSESSGEENIQLPDPLQPASDSDAGSFIEHNTNDSNNNHNNSTTKNKIDESQLATFEPNFYLRAIETYQLYIMSDEDADDEDDQKQDIKPLPAEPAATVDTPPPSAPNAVQGLSQEDFIEEPVHKQSMSMSIEGDSEQTADIIVKQAEVQPNDNDNQQKQIEVQQENDTNITANIANTDTDTVTDNVADKVTDDAKEKDVDNEMSAAAALPAVTATDAVSTTATAGDKEDDNNNDDDEEEEEETPPIPLISPTSPDRNSVAPKQSDIPIISEDAALTTDEPTDETPLAHLDDLKEEKKDQPPQKVRKLTKTKIVFKKVKRGPKLFKEGMKIRIQNNSKEQLTTPYHGTVGIIRWIGRIDNERLCGIEIIDDDVWGESDGSYKEVKYFDCPSKKSVFLSMKFIRKYVDEEARKKSNEFATKTRQRRRGRRNNAQMYGNIVDNTWQQRIDLVREGKYKIVRKTGPRDFGRIEYFGGDDEYTDALNDHTHWLAPRLTVPKRSKDETVEPKAGPRQIGRLDSYIGIEYNEEDEIRKRQQKMSQKEAKKRMEFERDRQWKLKMNKAIKTPTPGPKTPVSMPSTKKVSKLTLQKADSIKFKKRDSNETGSSAKGVSSNGGLKTAEGSPKKRSKSALPKTTNSSKKLKGVKSKKDVTNGNKKKSEMANGASKSSNDLQSQTKDKEKVKGKMKNNVKDKDKEKVNKLNSTTTTAAKGKRNSTTATKETKETKEKKDSNKGKVKDKEKEKDKEKGAKKKASTPKMTGNPKKQSLDSLKSNNSNTNSNANSNGKKPKLKIKVKNGSKIKASSTNNRPSSTKKAAAK